MIPPSLTMTFGFPAHHTEVAELDVERVVAREAICQAFDELGWQYQLIDVDTYHALVKMSGQSWGEEFEVSLSDSGHVKVVSTCRLITQCLDFGKNRRNAEQFLGTFRGKCIAIRRNAQPAPPAIDEQGRSPLGRLLDDESS